MKNTTIKPFSDNEKYLMYQIKRDMPYLNFRETCIIRQIILLNNNVEDRIRKLKLFGFKVKRCYVKDYNGLFHPTYCPKLNELRVIIGRPKNHNPKEVFAVIVDMNYKHRTFT